MDRRGGKSIEGTVWLAMGARRQGALRVLSAKVPGAGGVLVLWFWAMDESPVSRVTSVEWFKWGKNVWNRSLVFCKQVYSLGIRLRSAWQTTTNTPRCLTRPFHIHRCTGIRLS